MIKKLLSSLRSHFSPVRKGFKPISFRAGYDLTDMPIITVYQDDKKFNLLLDTGANCSTINADVLSELKHKKLDKKASAFGIGGEEQGRYYEIPFAFNGVVYIYPYLAINHTSSFKEIKDSTGVTVHGIIGSAFFNEFRYVIDFDQMIAYPKK